MNYNVKFVYSVGALAQKYMCMYNLKNTGHRVIDIKCSGQFYIVYRCLGFHGDFKVNQKFYEIITLLH